MKTERLGCILFILNWTRMSGCKGGQWYFQHTILNILAHVWVLYEYLITIIPVYLCSVTFVLISVNIYIYIFIYAELYSKVELNRRSELNDSCSKFKGKIEGKKSSSEICVVPLKCTFMLLDLVMSSKCA